MDNIFQAIDLPVSATSTTIARRVRALLALQGLALPDLCRLTGYGRSTVDGHLAGRQTMTLRGRGRDKGDPLPVDVYARALGVPVECLTAPEPWQLADGAPIEPHT